MFSWLSFAGDDQNDVVLTPRYVAHLMAKLCRVDMDSYVWDYATGTAGLLVAAMHQMIQDAKKNIDSPQELSTKIDNIGRNQILGLEILPEIYMLAVLNMILMGDGSSNIINKDSLNDYNGNYGYEKTEEKFPANVFLLNPPYSKEGNGMIFVKSALSKMEKGYAAVIIQDSAGSGQAKTFNQDILKKNTLLASIKMPRDLFRGKSIVQTSIYVFKVNERHEEKSPVRFIDFSQDGYQRSARKNAGENKKLKDIDGEADLRYEEVVNLVKFGKKELKIFSEKEFIEDTISLSGDKYGADWNFDQHRKKSDYVSNESYINVIGDFMSWKIDNMKDDFKIDINSYTMKLNQLEENFIDNDGEWIKIKVTDYFEISGTKGVNRSKLTNDNVPVVTNTKFNNGISKYINYEATEEGGVITYSDTTGTEQIFYQPNPFIGFSHIKKLVPKEPEKWNENRMLYFISALKHQIDGDYDYAHKLNDMEKILVSLPTKNNVIDFDFMDAFMKEVRTIKLLVLKDELDHKLSLYNSLD